MRLHPRKARGLGQYAGIIRYPYIPPMPSIYTGGSPLLPKPPIPTTPLAQLPGVTPGPVATRTTVKPGPIAAPMVPQITQDISAAYAASGGSSTDVATAGPFDSVLAWLQGDSLGLGIPNYLLAGGALVAYFALKKPKGRFQ